MNVPFNVTEMVGSEDDESETEECNIKMSQPVLVGVSILVMNCTARIMLMKFF